MRVCYFIPPFTKTCIEFRKIDNLHLKLMVVATFRLPLGCVSHYKYRNYDSQAEACGYQFSHFAEVCIKFVFWG